MIMFLRTISVIGISRNHIVAAKVRSFDKKIVKAYEYEYALSDLSEFILKAKSDLNTSRVRILISDDLAYMLKLKVPEKLSGDDEREFVHQKIKSEIPENLEDHEWDYKEIDMPNKEDIDSKSVLVFSMVKSVHNKLKDAIDKADVVIEAIEPASIAKERYENPIVGLALKKDLQGKDEDVLNLLIEPQSKRVFQFRGVGKKAVIFLASLLLVLIAGVFLYKNGFLPFSEKESGEVGVSQKEVIVETNSDTPVQVYSIKLVNGSVDENVNSIKENLQDVGFTDIGIDNIEELSYETTVVKTKDDVTKNTLDKIKAALSEYETIYPESFLDKSSEYDIEIIVGTGLTDE